MVLMSVSNDEAGDFRSKPRWSANRKIDVVLRLLRGESLEDVSREVGVEAHRLAAWPDDFFGVGQAGSETEASPGRGGPAPLGGGTQDRRGDGGGGDLAAGGRKKGASDPAAEAAEIAAEGPFPLARVCEAPAASRSTVYHRRLPGDALGRRPGPLTDIADDQLTELIRRVIADSPFAGEGYRTARTRLRHRHCRRPAGRADPPGGRRLAVRGGGIPQSAGPAPPPARHRSRREAGVAADATPWAVGSPTSQGAGSTTSPRRDDHPRRPEPAVGNRRHHGLDPPRWVGVGVRQRRSLVSRSVDPRR